MPDFRLSITALINPTLPESPSSLSTSPSLSSPIPLPYQSNPYPDPQHLQQTLSPSLHTPTPPRPSHTPPTPTSPQTIIVKTPRGKRHRCTFHGCGRDFTRLSNLKAHWRRHSGEEPYSCMHCSRKFKWRSSLKSHELGCVYEYTKTNTAVTWVYVATEQPQSQQQQQTQLQQQRLPEVHPPLNHYPVKMEPQLRRFRAVDVPPAPVHSVKAFGADMFAHQRPLAPVDAGSWA